MSKHHHHSHLHPDCLKKSQKQGLWERYVSPVAINCACGSRPFARQRSRIVPQAKGVVLELGMGTGLNLPFYDKDKVKKVIGIDPGVSLLKKAGQNIENAPFEVEVVCDSAEDMPLESNMIDSAMVTYTFCSIPDADLALQEVRRVLKPGGKLYFCEHGLSDNASTARWQNRLNPAWHSIAGGCNMNRDITKMVKEAGFDLEYHENFLLEKAPSILGYHHYGIAKPR